MLKGLGCFGYARHGFCIVTLCRGKTNERDFYAFVAIEPQNYGFFKKRYKDGESSSFSAYGFELLRGWGAEPPAEVLEHMKLKHGIEFGLSEMFLNRLIQNTGAFLAPLPPEQTTHSVLQ